MVKYYVIKNMLNNEYVHAEGTSASNTVPDILFATKWDDKIYAMDWLNSLTDLTFPYYTLIPIYIKK